MRKLVLRKVTIILLVFSMVLALAIPAMAEVEYEKQFTSVINNDLFRDIDMDNVINTMQILAPYFETRQDGTLQLTKGMGQLANALELENEDVLEVHHFLQLFLNPYIRENNRLISDVSITDDGIEMSIPDEKVIEELNRLGYGNITDEVQEDIGLLSYGCNGVTKLVFRNNGIVDVYLSKIVVQSIIVAGGAAAAILVSLIPVLGWQIAAAMATAVITFVGTQNAFAVVVRTNNLTSVRWVLPQCPIFCNC